MLTSLPKAKLQEIYIPTNVQSTHQMIPLREDRLLLETWGFQQLDSLQRRALVFELVLRRFLQQHFLDTARYE